MLIPFKKKIEKIQNIYKPPMFVLVLSLSTYLYIHEEHFYNHFHPNLVTFF